MYFISDIKKMLSSRIVQITFIFLLVTIVIPVILLYAITFAFDSVPLLLPYDIRIIIQPRSANAITEIVTKQDFEITFCAWIVADSFLTLIGLARNKDIL